MSRLMCGQVVSTLSLFYLLFRLTTTEPGIEAGIRQALVRRKRFFRAEDGVLKFSRQFSSKALSGFRCFSPPTVVIASSDCGGCRTSKRSAYKRSASHRRYIVRGSGCSSCNRNNYYVPPPQPIYIVQQPPQEVVQQPPPETVINEYPTYVQNNIHNHIQAGPTRHIYVDGDAGYDDDDDRVGYVVRTRYNRHYHRHQHVHHHHYHNSEQPGARSASQDSHPPGEHQHEEGDGSEHGR